CVPRRLSPSPWLAGLLGLRLGTRRRAPSRVWISRGSRVLESSVCPPRLAATVLPLRPPPMSLRNTAPLAVVAGAVAQRPGLGGHAWVFLNWLLGLRSLGFDVLFLDRLEDDMLARPGNPIDRSEEWSWLGAVMTGAGLRGSFAVLSHDGRRCLGMSRREVVERCRRAVVLFNIMGFLNDEELLAAAGR